MKEARLVTELFLDQVLARPSEAKHVGLFYARATSDWIAVDNSGPRANVEHHYAENLAIAWLTGFMPENEDWPDNFL